MKKALLALGVLVLIGAIFGGMYVSARNQMVRKNETVKSDWAQVDVVLERRADLIPNLVATVKGIAAQEVTVFTAVANARANLMNAQSPKDKIAANQQLDGALVKVLALTENYPQLRSNESFLRLQDELAGTENRIAVERRRYDDAIQDYNTYIATFPNNVFAGWAGFQRNDAYFTATPASRAVPKVEFPAAKQ
ncbi:MAG TPA: LemA family protein [Candidatus Acidoferrales bacterium]|nr:LemA family protein [Candidatus Acidoferrales bacterium]